MERPCCTANKNSEKFSPPGNDPIINAGLEEMSAVVLADQAQAERLIFLIFLK